MAAQAPQHLLGSSCAQSSFHRAGDGASRRASRSPPHSASCSASFLVGSTHSRPGGSGSTVPSTQVWERAGARVQAFRWILEFMPITLMTIFLQYNNFLRIPNSEESIKNASFSSLTHSIHGCRDSLLTHKAILLHRFPPIFPHCSYTPVTRLHSPMLQQVLLHFR